MGGGQLEIAVISVPLWLEQRHTRGHVLDDQGLVSSENGKPQALSSLWRESRCVGQFLCLRGESRMIHFLPLRAANVLQAV